MPLEKKKKNRKKHTRHYILSCSSFIIAQCMKLFCSCKQYFLIVCVSVVGLFVSDLFFLAGTRFLIMASWSTFLNHDNLFY